MRRHAAYAVVAAAVTGHLATAASAHVVVSADRLPAERPSLLGVVAQEERKGHATVRVTLAAPADAELRPVSAKRGTLTAVGPRVRWTRDRSRASGSSPTFVVEVTPGSRAGPLDLRAVQTYDDGVTRRWVVTVAVSPPAGAVAPKQHLGRALVIGAVGLVLVLASFLALHWFRRPELQDS